MSITLEGIEVMTMAEAEQKEQAEREKLEKEKIALAKKLGIWGEYKPKDENFQETEEFKRIQEIDQRLSEIING
jgi:hypothetical protein